jgi:ferric-dicitrate binding protein FerR (iron transport regulator)
MVNKKEEFKKIAQKYLNNELEVSESSLFKNLLLDEKNDSIVKDVLSELWEEGGWQQPVDGYALRTDEVLWQLHQHMDVTKKRTIYRKVLINLSRIAAVLVIGFLLGIVFNVPSPKSENKLMVSVPKGSISHLVLPDSSLVVMNGGSSIEYSGEWDKNSKREITLSGEAWFDIRKDSQRPFTVHTTTYDVRVLGTKFNVKCYETDKEAITTLEEGKVEVVVPYLGDNKVYQLLPGQQMAYNKETKAGLVQDVNTILYSSWKDNRIIFNNMALEELFVLLERRFGINIVVDDPSLLGYHYDGVIVNESIIQVMELISLTLPLTYDIKNQVIYIKRERR